MYKMALSHHSLYVYHITESMKHHGPFRYTHLHHYHHSRLNRTRMIMVGYQLHHHNVIWMILLCESDTWCVSTGETVMSESFTTEVSALVSQLNKLNEIATFVRWHASDRSTWLTGFWLWIHYACHWDTQQTQWKNMDTSSTYFLSTISAHVSIRKLREHNGNTLVGRWHISETNEWLSYDNYSDSSLELDIVALFTWVYINIIINTHEVFLVKCVIITRNL